jgi:hypothetical protein
MFKKFSKKHGITVDCEVLSDGTTAFWVGILSSNSMVVVFAFQLQSPVLTICGVLKSLLPKRAKILVS